MYCCIAYGLRIASELTLPEVPAETFDVPDVTVRLGPEAMPQGDDADGACRRDGEGIEVSWPDTGTFHVRGGREVCIQPLPGLALEVLRSYLLGPILGALLHQRGHLVLHASAAAGPGGAVLFAGECGSGKSTTAAALHRSGWPLLTDDVAALSLAEPTCILPGFPRFKLWPDAALRFGLDPASLPRIRPTLDKRDHSVRHNFHGQPLPLDRLYLLREGPALSVTQLGRREAFLELVGQTYTGPLLNLTDTRTRHFHQLGRLVQNAPVFRLTRPRDLDQLPAVVETVKGHMAWRPVHH